MRRLLTFFQSMRRIVNMHDVHVGDLDLNLLVALRALIAERHVTRAAARVKLTQPAMSHSLARLRNALGDPILIRTRSGMMLTPRAQELAEPLDRVMRDVARLFASARAFDPALATRGYTGGIVDTALAKIGKRRRIAAEVPHFLVAPFLIEKADLVLTLPERVARALAPVAKIRQLAPPPELDLPGFDISLLWHQRNRAEPAHEWFRRVIAGVAKGI